MLPVFTGEEMRRLDQRAIQELGIPGATLMENAGRGAALVIVESLPDLGVGAHVAIVCGRGGNGGDGFVVARLLAEQGVHVSVWLATPPDEVRGDAAGKLEALAAAGIQPAQVTDDLAVAEALGRANLVVDALLGTGSLGLRKRRWPDCSS